MFIVGFLFTLLVVLFIVSKTKNIGLSLLLGGFLLMVLNQFSPLEMAETVRMTLFEQTALDLALTIAMITVLGHLMESYGLMTRMINAIEQMMRSAKATILIAPAIIGTLLVTGGALMSCPVVGELGDRLSLPQSKKASINLIFRHALYFVFPFSPPMILAAKVGGFSIWDFILLQMPISIAMYALGWFFYLRDLKEPAPTATTGTWVHAFGQFIVFSSPIWISFAGALALNLPFYGSLGVGAVTSFLIHLYDRRQRIITTDKNVLTLCIEGIRPKMIFAVLGIFFFKNVVNQLDALYTFIESILSYGIPIEILIFVSTALISFSVASTQPSIAILFPIILPMAPDPQTQLLYAMFIYTTAFLFYYISPLHMCQVLTLEYFDVKIKDLYRQYIPLLPLTYVVMVVVYLAAGVL